MEASFAYQYQDLQSNFQHFSDLRSQYLLEVLYIFFKVTIGISFPIPGTNACVVFPKYYLKVQSVVLLNLPRPTTIEILNLSFHSVGLTGTY